MDSKRLTLICACLIILVLAISSAVVVINGNNNHDTSENSVAKETSSTVSDPLAEMQGTDLYKATHSDLIIVGVVQFDDGSYKCYGGSADGITWGYTNYNSHGDRLGSFSVGSDRKAIENMYHSISNSGNCRVII